MNWNFPFASKVQIGAVGSECQHYLASQESLTRKCLIKAMSNVRLLGEEQVQKNASTVPQEKYCFHKSLNRCQLGNASYNHSAVEPRNHVMALLYLSFNQISKIVCPRCFLVVMLNICRVLQQCKNILFLFTMLMQFSVQRSRRSQHKLTPVAVISVLLLISQRLTHAVQPPSSENRNDTIYFIYIHINAYTCIDFVK